ncbi:ATP-binding protein, partial [Thermococci archaeon]
TMDFIAYKVLEGVYSKLLNGEFDYPVFVFVEEAHKLVPSKKSTMSSEIINTIATEGRKFGMFLVLITQRPSRINSESLSQCNSQIILRITNPVDQNAVRMASERMSEELLRDLPGLNVGEAIIVGEVTKVPVMVKIRERRTMEGGADIDIVSKLRDARDEVRQGRGHEEFIRPSKMFSEV